MVKDKVLEYIEDIDRKDDNWIMLLSGNQETFGQYLEGSGVKMISALASLMMANEVMADLFKQTVSFYEMIKNEHKNQEVN